MEKASLLVVAMAEKCGVLIQESEATDAGLPQALHPRHLLWMSECIRNHAEDWPATRLHRWIGFVQCGMVANRMLDLDAAKAMFDEAHVAFGQPSDDLIDHLDPASSFKLEIGGEG